MASAFLVVKTTSVFMAPVSPQEVTAAFDEATAAPMAVVGPGMCECPVPAGASRVRISIASGGDLWDAEQLLVVDTTSSPPTARFDVAQHLNTRLLAVATRGAEFNIELHVTLGQLKDVTDSVFAQAGGDGLDLSTPPRSLLRMATPIVNPAGSGQGLFNGTAAAVTFRGRIFVAARKNTPQLIVLVHPGWNNPLTQEQARIPIPFHVFFHPFIPWADPYPLGRNYLWFIQRYLINDFKTADGKAMLYQNVADTLKNVLVLPVGSHASWMGDLTSESALLRLLKESAFFLQRVRGVSLPTQSVGPSAMSCFSAGARWMAQIFNGPRVREFHEKVLRDVFVFDGVFDGESGAAETAGFCAGLAKWFSEDPASRSLRVYTQSALWFDQLRK